ncbi:MAG TPA: ABC transporter ATP-binding protein [Ktedonobacteraceae bacterium]|nr:ABC transporter ATP-binding protein [Ktedonobacteraceae bacterium]
MKKHNGGPQLLIPLLQVNGISFGYNSQPLLYDIHTRIDAGEMVGLLGPNGSGKTTLLRLISGVLRPQQGKILLEGRDLQAWGRRGIAQRIAVVPQELHVPFAFTVEEMVSMGRTPFINLLGTRNKQDISIVQEAMQSTEITPLAGRIFNELSGGERQRVIMAMALAQQPALLLLDEPTSHLDIKYQIEILELVQRLNHRLGVTVIAAMHDLNLAARYFPRLLLFQRGIVADAGPAEVLEPHLLRRVYGIDVQVGILRGAEHLSVLPPGEATLGIEHEQPIQPKIHLMAGGGSGELLMRGLADAHIPFIAGALNIGDSDYALALRLASEVISEQPYAPVSTAALEQVRASLRQGSLLIVCSMPIGPGNLSLLQEAAAAAKRGLSVLLFAPDTSDVPDEALNPEDRLLQRTGIVSRDYTDGEGAKLIREMLEAGAMVVGALGEAIEAAKHYA